MPLFQQSVLKKYSSDLDKTELQKSWKLFSEHFHDSAKQANIRNLKEEEYQEGFVRDLFVSVLGYTLNPQPAYNFVLEKKSTTDATKSDGAILIKNEVVAVIELKDTGTPDLDKVSTQAFGYKHKHANCVYVITSNFEKLRFYINDATDYEEFNLFTLSPDRFAVLYLCLHQKNVQNSIPLQLKQNSLLQEENVTKKLYADYSLFKRQLFHSILQLNAEYDKLLLFKKTQKLLDRFLFILFAEDRLLLPPNSIREILSQWEQLKELDNYVPLYERFKKYFGYLNTGYTGKKHEIFAYNGGLFLPDETLDAIIIDDAILYNGTKTLSNYDYETDVDVNILGHIFEHSLSEIEELQAELEGKKVEKNKTKRKKDGVFYTPRYITKYIVENTVGALCTQQKTALNLNEETFEPKKRKDKRKALLDIIEAYRAWLLQLTICDPACGSGAFLNAALEYLINEHRTLDELTARIFNTPIVYPDIQNSILENNLFGVDINEDAIEIAKLSLWLHTAKKGRKLSNLSNNIKCGNSLIDDATVAGDKAFTWKEEFKTVFDKGGFDVVIGNPPYVRVEFIEKINVDFYKNSYSSATGKFDLSSLFIEKSIKILNTKGQIALISSYQFIYTSSGIGIRKFISKNTNAQFLLFSSDAQVFKDATTYTGIMHFQLDNADKIIINKARISENEIFINETVIIEKSNFESEKVIVSHNLLISKIKGNLKILLGKEIGSARTGVVTSSDEIFFISKKLIKENNLESELIYPIIGSDEIEKWFLNETNTYCLYPYKEENNKTTLLTIDFIEFNYPNIFTYLLNRRDILQSRSQGRKDYSNSDKWYQLNRPREKWIYDTNKILYPGTVNKSSFSLDVNGQMFRNARSYAFILNESADIDLYKVVLCILNSKLCYFLISNLCPPKSGGYFELSTGFLENFPFVLPKENTLFINQADIMLSKNIELNQSVQQFTHLLQTKFTALNINNKLQSWASLSSSEFLKELDKQKINLSLSAQQEWLQYFEEQKIKASNIQQIIQQTDKQIDEMVYELYELTAEEIKIVESA